MNAARLLGIALVAALLLTACSSEDSSPTQSKVPQGNFYRVHGYQVETQLPCFVNILFQVTDVNGRGVTSLRTNDFNLYEDGDPVSPTESFPLVKKRENIPYRLRTVLLLDNSASVGANLDEIKSAAIALVDNIADQQEFAVYKFSDSAILLQDFTDNVTLLRAAINSISLGSNTTDLYGSVMKGVSRWSDYHRVTGVQQGFLILLTDGSDTQHSYTLQQALAARGTKRVYALGLGNEIEPDKLVQLGNAGFYAISNVSDVATRFQEIQSDMVRWANSFYWLLYMSPTRVGTHTLKLEVVGNDNSEQTSFFERTFSSQGFYSVSAGVQLSIGGTGSIGLDSIACNLNTPVELVAATYMATELPAYSWSASTSAISLTAQDSRAQIVQVTVDGAVGQGATITATDTANGMSKQISVSLMTNAIMVDPSPDSIDAPWSLSGPLGLSMSGQGDTTLSDMVLGQYILTWNDLEGYRTPAPSTRHLTEHSNLTFSGNYRALGRIIVDPDPDSLNAGWTISGPNGFSLAGSGEDTVITPDVGHYTVTWSEIEGWQEPAAATRHVTYEEEETFRGIYNQLGTAIIQPIPDSLAAPWTLAGPSIGYSESGVGTDTLANLQPGAYVIQWGEVTGWSGPAEEIQSIGLNSVATFVGNYGLRPALIIDCEPDSLHAPWSFTGPGISGSGSGDEVIPGMAPGNVTITWGDVPGWSAPSPVSAALGLNDTVTVLGQYLPFGSLLIDCEPDSLNAAWSLEGPGGFEHSGNGDDTVRSLAPGEYTVTWGPHTDWATPPPVTATVSVNGTVAVLGQYLPPASVLVDCEPDSLDAAWLLEGPGGFEHSGNGDDTVGSLAPGEYTITWSQYAEWITPSADSAIVSLGGELSFQGEYYWCMACSSGTVVDASGNSYSTVKIGDQWWMAENLRTINYRNGQGVGYVSEMMSHMWAVIGSSGVPAAISWSDDPDSIEVYGLLYNWYAVNDERSIAPEGWHVATDDDWKRLERYLGMNAAAADSAGFRGTDEGGKLKDSGTVTWNAPNQGATNTTGFTALPWGYRSTDAFSHFGTHAWFWTSTEIDTNIARNRGLMHDTAVIRRGGPDKANGFSVRCVKD